MRMVRSSFIALAAAGALVGCGGGGGGGGGGGSAGGTPGGGGVGSGSAPVVAYPRSGDGSLSSEASRNYEIAAVGALGANVAGKTGAGITVGVVDTGIDTTHADFAGAIDAASTNIVTGNAADVQDQAGHGTAVAGIIAARADGYDTRGVAPGANLLAIRSDGACGLGCFNQSDLAAATDYAAGHGARIINYSLGGTSIGPAWQAAMTRFLASGIIVAAAGNAAGANPIDPANWLAGQNNGLAVGAVDANNLLAAFSNKAGTAKDHFLVAPGVTVISSRLGGGVTTANGTSFAAPAVSGAAAVVWGASPYLTGKQVVDILLNSATDLGAAGVDDVYGHGLLNLNAALQPVGGTSIPTGQNVSAGGAPVSSTALSLGGAFGNALSRGNALSQAIMVDGYGRPFHVDLSSTVQSPPKADPLADWLGPNAVRVTTTRFGRNGALTLAAPEQPLPDIAKSRPGEESEAPRFALNTEIDGTRLGLARGFGLDRMSGLAAAAPELDGGLTGTALSSPYLALSGTGTALSAGRELGDGMALSFGYGEDGGRHAPADQPEAGRKAALAELTKHFQDGSVIGGHVGSLTEAGGPLASASGGAFDFGKPADTLFMDLFAATPLGDGVTMFGRAGMGRTDGSALDSGLLRDAATLTSQTYAVGATARDIGLEGDSVTLSAAKPLRVSSGSATMAVPVGRAMDGTVLTQQQRIKLSPTGSETDFELSWAVPVGERQHLVLGGLMAVEPGHDASAAPAFAAGAKYRLTW